MAKADSLNINILNSYIPFESSSFEIISENISFYEENSILINEKIYFCTKLNCETKIKYDSFPIIFPAFFLKNESFTTIMDMQTSNINKTYNIISILKSKKIIDNYYWTIKLDNLTHGKIIIGDLPDKYEMEIYKNKKLYFINTYSKLNRIFWGFQFSALKFAQITLTNYMQGKLYPKISEIIGSYEYISAIEKIFFQKYIDNNYICRRTFDELDGEDIFRFICDEDKFNKTDINNFPNLTLINTDLNYSFTFQGEELFFENNGKIYFMIVSKIGKDDGDWMLGRIFLYKYQFVMDNDNNLIGIYKDNIGGNNNGDGFKLMYIFLIGLVIILIIILGIMIALFKKGLCKYRKTRISEIDDDFMYITKDEE